MANKLYEESNVQAIAQAIREKNGTANTYKLADMADAVREIRTGAENAAHSWNQIPTAVKNFLDNVTYNPGDYSGSQIANYAPATADINNTYPIGKTIETVSGILDRNGYEMSVSSGNTTVYNDVPNQFTEFVNRDAGTVFRVGTLKPTGALRQIKCATSNVRDLGGWNCDGGTVKYGKLFRGGEFQTADTDIFVNQLGIRHELNLRGTAEAESEKTVLRDYVKYTCPEKYVWYTITGYNDTWREIIRCVFDAVKNNEPVYFHCAAGADRTGTVACILEALLGISQSDIDKDYELTCFASGVATDSVARRRDETSWKGLIEQINALSIGSTFRDKVINWVASLGFTADEINAYRATMIDGIPDTISLNVATYSVTNTIGKVETDNAATSAVQYQPYEAKVIAPIGYVIGNVKIVMSGVDITSSAFKGNKTNLGREVNKTLTNCTIDNTKKAVINGQGYGATLIADTGYTLDGGTVIITMGGVDVSTYYSGGKIAIPCVTGDIVITATAVKSAPNYTNLADPSSADWVVGRLNSSGEVSTDSTTSIVTNFIRCNDVVGDVVRVKGLGALDKFSTSVKNASKGNLGSGLASNSSGYYYTYSYDDTTGVVTLTTTKAIGYFRFSGILDSTAENVVITLNEPID